MKFYTIHKFSKLLGVTPQTLRNWEKSGKLIPHHKIGNGYRYYSEEQLSSIIKEKPRKRITLGYCRVSFQKQKEELAKQVENVKSYLLSQGEPFEIIQDIGSGICWKKKILEEILFRINNDEIQKIVVLNKDRLPLFTFEFINYFSKLHDCTIEVIENNEDDEISEEIEGDIYQILSTYNKSLQGKNSKKVKKIINILMSKKDIDNYLLKMCNNIQ